MLDALKNLGDLSELTKKAAEMRDQMRKMQEELAKIQVTAEAGGGMARATVNGHLILTRLQIDKSKIDPKDIEMLEDVIVAAVRAAQERVAETARAEMHKRVDGLGLFNDGRP